MKADDILTKAYKCILDNDFEQAINCFEQAIASEPERADVRYRCSITYARSGKLDMAIHHAEEAMRLAPEEQNYALHHLRLKAKQMTQDAVKMLQFRQDSDHETALKAVRLLESAARMDPLSAQTQIWLAVAYGELKDYRRALAAVWEASALMQDDPVSEHLKKLEQRFKTYMDHTTN